MKNNRIRNCLIIGTIFLFFGASIASSVYANVEQFSNKSSVGTFLQNRILLSNNEGRLDLAVANYEDITILFGDGTALQILLTHKRNDDFRVE